MLSEALINTLGVATWYILGIAYTSTASRYWPQKESFRGKWLPQDVYEVMSTDREYRQYQALPGNLLKVCVVVAFLMFLTIWPIAVYSHAKRKFRTERDET